jgi:DNA-binding CsgD family transcriptional regulator
MWQLAAGEARDPELLLAAAVDARARGEIRLMGRLAAASAQVGGGVEARVLVALATRDSGEDENAVPLLTALLEEDLSDATRARVTEVLATSLAHKLARADEARTLIVNNAARVTDAHSIAMLAAVHRALFTGEDPPFGPSSDPDHDETPRLLQWIGESQTNLMAGRFDRVIASSNEMRQMADRLRDARPEGRLWVGVLRFYACMHLCRFAEAESLARGALELVMDHPQGTARAWWLDLLGTAMLEQGRVAEATKVLEEAAALRRRDDPGLLVGSLLMLAVARAQLGEVDSAQNALNEARGCPVGLLTPLIEMPRAEAAVLAAGGRVPSAQQMCVAYARHAHENSRDLYEFWGWRDAARYGAPREAFDGITALSGSLDGPIAGLFERALGARLQRDAGALLAAANDLAAHGLLLDAAEHLHVASEFADGEVVRPIRRRWEELRAQLPDVRTPLLPGTASPTLSRREREVAVLAAAGMRDAEIAAELVVSVRTVNAHLRAVYTKLGITSRHEIADALAEAS